MNFLILIMTISFAQSSPEAAAPIVAPPKVIYKKTEQHRFSGAQLKGSLKKPELSYIYERKGIRQDKIVNIPENFDQEIYNGATQF